MTRPPQRARQRRPGLSVVAIRLGLLALVSYPVLPWPAQSTVGVAESGGSGPRSAPESTAMSPPTVGQGPCLSITGGPGVPVIDLSLAHDRCGSGGGSGSTGAWGVPEGSYFRSRFGGEHRDGVSARSGRPDPLRDRVGNPWSPQSRPFVGDVPPRKARSGRTPE